MCFSLGSVIARSELHGILRFFGQDEDPEGGFGKNKLLAEVYNTIEATFKIVTATNIVRKIFCKGFSLRRAAPVSEALRGLLLKRKEDAFAAISLKTK